jgi:excisionase family DNA binding protein
MVDRKVPEQSAKRTMTVEEAARALGLSRNGAYEAARRGDLPTIRMGRRLLVPIAAFEALLAQPR